MRDFNEMSRQEEEALNQEHKQYVVSWFGEAIQLWKKEHLQGDIPLVFSDKFADELMLLLRTAHPDEIIWLMTSMGYLAGPREVVMTIRHIKDEDAPLMPAKRVD